MFQFTLWLKLVCLVHLSKLFSKNSIFEEDIFPEDDIIIKSDYKFFWHLQHKIQKYLSGFLEVNWGYGKPDFYNQVLKISIFGCFLMFFQLSKNPWKRRIMEQMDPYSSYSDKTNPAGITLQVTNHWFLKAIRGSFRRIASCFFKLQKNLILEFLMTSSAAIVWFLRKLFYWSNILLFGNILGTFYSIRLRFEIQFGFFHQNIWWLINFNWTNCIVFIIANLSVFSYSF